MIINQVEVPTITYFFTDLLLFTERDLKSNSFKFLKYLMITHQSQIQSLENQIGFVLEGKGDSISMTSDNQANIDNIKSIILNCIELLKEKQKNKEYVISILKQ